MKFHKVVVSYTKKSGAKNRGRGAFMGSCSGRVQDIFYLIREVITRQKKTVNIFLKQYYFSCSGLIGDRNIL